VHVSTLMYLISCGNVRFEDNKIIKKVKKRGRVWLRKY